MRNLGKTVCATRLVYRGAGDLVAETSVKSGTGGSARRSIGRA